MRLNLLYLEHVGGQEPRSLFLRVQNSRLPLPWLRFQVAHIPVISGVQVPTHSPLLRVGLIADD